MARGSLSKEDADNHPERESLTSFIGAESLEEIDRNPEPLPMAAGDTILLASDGMFKTLDAQEIAASLHGAPQTWVAGVAGGANHRQEARISGQRDGAFGDGGRDEQIDES